MKATAIALLSVLAIVCAYMSLAYFALPSLFPPFYYAEFNRARDHLSRIPGVRIIDHWQYHDIILEDCGFTLRVNDSEPVLINFYDGDDWELPFKRVDGVTVCYPYNPKTNDYDEVSFSAQQLRENGIDAANLGTVLQDIEKLLEIAKPMKVPRSNSPRPGVWVRIFRDLNRYKEAEPQR